jgi:hypothetical protein
LSALSEASRYNNKKKSEFCTRSEKNSRAYALSNVAIWISYNNERSVMILIEIIKNYGINYIEYAVICMALIVMIILTIYINENLTYNVNRMPYSY